MKKDYRVLYHTYYNRAIVQETMNYYSVQQKKRFLFWTYWGTFKEREYDGLSTIKFKTEYEAEDFINRLKQGFISEGWITEIVTVKRIKLLEKISKR